jgi:PrcB C-terminal
MRDAVLIFIAIILAMAIGGYLFLYDGKGLKTPFDEEGPLIAAASYTTIQEGQNSGSLDRRTNLRIKSDEELFELWRMVFGANAPAIPLIDFSSEEIIAVFDGTHSTGGYKVEVTDITDEGGKRVVHIRRTAPGENCQVTTGITSPYQIVRVKKTLLPVTKEEETVLNHCP